MLLEYLLDKPSIINGRRVLELGAGLGLLGIGLSTSQCPPSHYTLTDLHPTVLDTLKHNVSINIPAAGGDGGNAALAVDDAGEADEIQKEVAKVKRAAVIVDVERLDWEDKEQLELWTQKPPYDLILAADVVFDPSLYRPLLRTICSCLNNYAMPDKCSVPATTSSPESSNDTGTNECKPPNVTDTTPSEEIARLDLNSPADISSKNYSTSIHTQALQINNHDSNVEALSIGVDLLRKERSENNSGYPLRYGSPSPSRRPVAILAATVRNEEALNSFISLLDSHELSVTEQTEKIYQLSPSQPQHRVRILHITTTR